MSLDIFCKPRLLINDKEVAFCKTASFSTNVTSLQTLSATITEPDFENYNLFNSDMGSIFIKPTIRYQNGKSGSPDYSRMKFELTTQIKFK